MSKESWVSPSDNLDHFDASKPWPDQYVEHDGVGEYIPARNNYTFGNRSLPASRHREALLDAITETTHPVMVLSGDTGSGKTTQAIQMIYEAGVAEKIVQAQPRIPLTRQACYRVREEMSYALGEPGAADHLIGYATGYDSDYTRDNKMLVATNGKALRMLMHHPEEFRGAVFMVDEFHLREIEADLIVACCVKNGIKLILSSATLNQDRIAGAFTDRNGDAAPIVEVRTRQYKITEIQSDDVLSEDAATYASQKDSIIFMPGRSTIQRNIGKVARKLSRQTNVMELHGEQTKAQQQAVFDQSYGTRTIFSTNVGEMGMTFGVDVVLNPGYERAPILMNGVRTLTERPASQAKNKQRAGRTGRTGDGLVVYGSKMDGYPKLPPVSQLPEYDTPDMQTQRIDKVLLLLLSRGETFDTLPLISRPSDEEVERACVRFRKYGAIDAANQCTDIGHRMTRLPLEPEYARSFVESERYSEDLPSIRAQMAALVAVQQTQGIISTSPGQDGWKTVVSNDSLSDPIYATNVFIWANNPDLSEDIWQRKGIVEPKMRRARDIFKEICTREGIDPSSLKSITRQDEKEAIIACLIAGAEEVFVRRSRETYSDVRGEKRTTQRNAMVGKDKILIGMPWNLQSYQGEMLTTRQYILSPTAVSREQLEKYAPERCTYATDGYTMDTWGFVTARKALYFDGMYVDSDGKEAAMPSAELRDYLVESLFNKAMLKKRELPQNIASFCKQVAEVRYQENKVDFDLEIENRLGSLLQQLQQRVPETVTSLEQLEAYIDPIMVSEVIDADEYEEIRTHSPDTVVLRVGDEMVEVPVEYDNNQVRVCVTFEQLNYLPERFDEFENGRDVKVRVDGRSRLLTLEQAFDRAQHPARSHWRNTPHDETPEVVTLSQRTTKDADNGAVSVRQLTPESVPPVGRERGHRQQYA